MLEENISKSLKIFIYRKKMGSRLLFKHNVQKSIYQNSQIYSLTKKHNNLKSLYLFNYMKIF